LWERHISLKKLRNIDDDYYNVVQYMFLAHTNTLNNNSNNNNNYNHPRCVSLVITAWRVLKL